MTGLPSHVRGIVLMVLATGAFTVNDTFFKLATEDLPVFQSLFLRGAAAAIFCLPLVLFSGAITKMARIFDRWAMLRSAFEIASVFCILNALARIPIADITAIAQLAPMLLMIAAALIFREKLGLWRVGLMVLGFAGALMIAQPQADGISPYMVLGIVGAVLLACRDLIARKVPEDIPGSIVTYGVVLMVMVASLAVTMLTGEWVDPPLHALGYLLASGLFVMFGHHFIFLSFRAAPVGVVAPFFYSATIWALLLGFLVFGEFPNALAIAGIGLILGSGVVLVMHSRKPVVAVPAAIDAKEGSDTEQFDIEKVPE